MYQVGGAEIYVKNKYLYLKSMGITCIVISESLDENLYLEIDPWNHYNLREINIPSYLFTPKRANKIISNLVNFLSRIIITNEIYIESHNIYPVTWAELLSQKISAFHYVYFLAPVKLSLLQEYFVNFVKSKIRINQFYQMSVSEQLFSFENIELTPLEKKNLRLLPIPFDIENFFIDSNNQLSDYISKSKVNILVIQRFDKYKSLIALFDELNHITNYELNIIVIGDSSNQKIKGKILRILNNKTFPHSVVHIKSIMPISFRSFDDVDLVIGHGTAAIASASTGTATIIYSGIINNAIGIFGVDQDCLELGATISTNSSVKLQNLLNIILMDHKNIEKYGKLAKLSFEKHFDFNMTMKQHLNILYKNWNEINNSFDNIVLSNKDKFKKIILFFGVEFYKFILYIKIKYSNLKGDVENRFFEKKRH